MEKLLIITLLVAYNTVNAQYSGYYSVNQNANKNVDVSGNINIATIDFGQLALTNSENEKSTAENLKYPDEKQKRIALAIASDPTKAYEYGFPYTFEVDGEDAKTSGFKKLKMSYRILPSSFFVQSGAGTFENVSLDGITTKIIFTIPEYHPEKDGFDAEKEAKLENEKVGELNEGPEGESCFVLKKNVNPATVFGVKGYSGTLIWENNTQYTITDNFSSYNESEGNGVSYFVKVRYYGNKDEVTFEQLEGRRYYLKKLIDKVVATAYAGGFEY